MLRWFSLTAVLACSACSRVPADATSTEPAEPTHSRPGLDQPTRTAELATLMERAAKPSQGMLRAEVLDLLAIPQPPPSPPAVVVLLKRPEDPDRVLPIYIGDREGQAIYDRMSNLGAPRPMTHDLLEKILDRRDLTVLKVEIDAIQDSTFLANLYLFDERDHQVMKIDARPSDCMVLATGASAPIYVAPEVFDRAGEPYSQWKEILDQLEQPTAPPPDRPPT